MPIQIVFISLFLGLIAGRQPVELQVSPAVTTVRILVDGHDAATLTTPPWRATIDFGASVEPRELVAVAFNGTGEEVGRASQIVNLPRPPAEFSIVLEPDSKGVPVSAALRWEHVLAAKPSRATVTVDGEKVLVDEKFRARLPVLDMPHPHVFAAEMRFTDGFVARREMVAGGTVADSINTELTPVLLTSQAAATPKASLDGCLMANGAPVRASALETPGALVLVVR